MTRYEKVYETAVSADAIDNPGNQQVIESLHPELQVNWSERRDDA